MIKRLNTILVLVVLTARAWAGTVYVANGGSDTNPGTQAAPVATLARAYALLADGDTLLLARGSTWAEPLGNKASSYRWQLIKTTIGAYGTGPAPVVIDGVGAGAVFNRQGGGGTRASIDGVTIQDLELRAGPGGTCINWLGGGKGLVIQRVRCIGGLVGIAIQGDAGGMVERPLLLECEVRDQAGKPGHAQGIFIGAANCGATLKRVTVRNVGMDAPDMYRQGLYITEGSGYTTLEACEFDLCSSHGAQVRSGGSVKRCLFRRCGIGLYIGWDASTGTAPNIIEENIVLEGRDIAPGVPRAMGIEVKAGHTAHLTRNVVANKAPGANAQGFAFKVTGAAATDPEDAVSVWADGNLSSAWGTGNGIWCAAANVGISSATAERVP